MVRRMEGFFWFFVGFGIGGFGMINIFQICDRSCSAEQTSQSDRKTKWLPQEYSNLGRTPGMSDDQLAAASDSPLISD